MLVKSYQFTGIDFGHLGQLDRNIMKQSGIREDLPVRTILILFRH